MKIRTYNTNKPVWTLEDTTEYVHYATSSRRDLYRHIEKNKDKYKDGQFIVCYYQTIRNLVPEDVMTMKRFILENKVISTWQRSKNLIRSLTE